MAPGHYQYGFSDFSTAMYDGPKRLRKAETMLAVLADYFSDTLLSSLTLLDIGASTGIIDNRLADAFARVDGIDIDHKALVYAKENFTRKQLHFSCADALQLPFDDARFDVVICAQIYEHVPCAVRMMDEIMRVLKPGGICYFSAGNRLQWREPHYGLPLLSVLPKSLAHHYIRMSGKGEEYYETHRSYWGLLQLVKNFERIDYTTKLVNSPQQFCIEYMIAPGSQRQKLAQWIVKQVYWLFPNYLWLLRKPANPSAAGQ